MQSLLIQVREVLARGDTTTALVLAGIAIAAILVIVGAVLFVARMYTPRGRLELLLESRVRERETAPWVSRVIVVLVVVLMLVGTTYYAERDETCVSCHADEAYTEMLAEGAHASVGCADCHRTSGPTGRVNDALRYAGWIASRYILDEQAEVGSGTDVDPRGCLECHDAVSEGVVETGGVRVRHSDFIGGGADCVTCHGDTGHSQLRGVQTQPVMNACMGCHDGEGAPVDCTYCHTQDLGVRAVAQRGGGMDTVGFRRVDCYTCHDRQPCTECHGSEMPHPPGFSFPAPRGLPTRIGTGLDAGTHAREGFRNREVCWRCHFAPGRPFEPSDEGCRCHGLFGFMHGGPAWVREHGLQATGQKPGALSACDSCHGPVTLFCGFCHPPSYAERYAPVAGADTYAPSPGWPRPADPLTDF